MELTKYRETIQRKIRLEGICALLFILWPNNMLILMAKIREENNMQCFLTTMYFAGRTFYNFRGNFYIHTTT